MPEKVLSLDGFQSLWQLNVSNKNNINKIRGLTMIKSELIAKLVDANPHLYQRDVERIVNTIFEEITNTLADGNRVELRGFGAFSVKHRPSRIGRNPRTGQAVDVPAKSVPYFKTGKDLREKLNE